MRISDRVVLLGALFCLLCGVRSYVRAQDTPSVDVSADVAEGIYHYMWGDQAGFERAIELFSSALEKEPGDPAALLFRSLSWGGLGLLERANKLTAQQREDDMQTLLEVRGQSDRPARIRREIEQLRESLAESTESPTARILDRERLDNLERLMNLVEGRANDTDEQILADMLEYRSQRYDAGNRERDHYRNMVADLERLVRALDEPGVVIHLLKVVAQAKIARNDEEEALGIRAGHVSKDRASGPVSALRSSAVDILKQIASQLEDIRPGLSGEDAVRTSFFLGVIRYRLAVPRRARTEEPEIDYEVLRQAEQIMRELVDDPQIGIRWRSYAALYLGLIIPLRSTLESDEQRRLDVLDEAARYVMQAAELDTVTPPGQEPSSASRGAIPTVVWRQREQIERLKTQPPSAPGQWNDVQLSLFAGAQRDTNVVLLGERTDLPRDISREQDYGFASGLIIDYTYTFADRWTLGVQGRVSSLWHADVDEFDEQRYGGSVAVQYELVRKEGRFGPVHLRLQYDYDYTLLGRSAFLESQALSPHVRIFWADRRAETGIYATYEIRDYREPLFDRRFNRDGRHLAFGIAQSFKVVDMTELYEEWGLEPWGARGDESFRQEDPDYPARYMTPFVGLRYKWDGTDGDEFDQKEYTLSIGVNAPLPWGIDLALTTDLQWQEYAHGSLIDFHRRPRRDFIQRYIIGLSRTFVLREGRQINRSRPPIDRVLMTLRAYVDFTQDDSNVVDRLGQAVFEYDRSMYGLSVAFTLN
ncbi:MAG: hypothetical protein ACE5HE_06065 [Phycisphaerae bacterium]